MAVLALSTPNVSADIYVSPGGNDAWSGRHAAPNRARTDGPFRTLQRALDEVARIRSQGGARRGVTVLVRRGTYVLDAPLEMDARHSGQEGAPTVIAAYPGEKPVITGGVRLTGWKVEDGRWVLDIPEVRDGKWYFEQLFVNGKRRYRPRLPKNAYFEIAAQAEPSPEAAGKGYDRFVFREGDIRADWHNREDVDVLVFQSWTMARLRIGDVDMANRTVRFAKPTLSAVWYFAMNAGHRYIVENVREALTEPGEWYLDRRSGRLTYIPVPGERPDRAEVWAPRLEYLLDLKGDPDTGRWVDHIVLRGLTFEHTNWVTPPEGYQFPQAEVSIPAAIRATGVRNSRFEGCVVRRIGHYAISLGVGCQRNVIEGCEITDMAAGGVKLGMEWEETKPERVSGYNTVRDCLIAHGGRMHPAAVGVWIGRSPGNVIAHNEICDLYYTGISIGWVWGYAPVKQYPTTIEYNYIHDIGQGVLSDMGGTYSLGQNMGSVQRFNVFRDIESFSYGGWGIYFDEGTYGMLAENNLVYRCSSAGFHQHYGRENIVRNNIFAFNRDSQLMRTRAEDHLSFTIERNIVYWETGPLLASNWQGSNYRFQNNLYWRVGGGPIDFAGASFEQWQAKGQDQGSVIADPLFVAPKKGDFRLRPGSPAEKIGFVPFDYSRAGRIGKGIARPESVWQPRAYPYPKAQLTPRPIALDFEDVPVGALSPQGVTNEGGGGASIRVTDETAASGKHSLKFVDKPGLSANYLPLFELYPRYRQGVVTVSFALRVEKGTLMYHEWRDAASPYRSGPYLRVEPDGSVRTRDRKLLDLPHGVWVRFDVRCGLGKKANGKYDVTVRLPGRTAPLVFRDLPMNPAFDQLHWMLFVADADAEGVFYLDDITVTDRSRR